MKKHRLNVLFVLRMVIAHFIGYFELVLIIFIRKNLLFIYFVF